MMKKLIQLLIAGILLLNCQDAFVQDSSQPGIEPSSPTLSGTDEDKKLFKKAERYFYEKKFEMAEIILQEVIKKNPENAEAYSYLGDILLYKKRYDGALNLYTRALDLKPDSAETLFRMGQLYYYKKMGAPAIDYFTRSVEKDSTMRYAYYHIGLCFLMLQRDKSNTITFWEKYLSIAPEDPQYDNLKRVVELLKDPNFTIPPQGSDITVEEALLLGGATLQKEERRADDKQAGHESKKTTEKIEEIYGQDDL